MRVLPALLAAAAFWACTGEQLRSADRRLSADTERLTFERTFIGYPTTRALEVRNEGLVDLQLVLEVEGPFRIAEPGLHLLAGERRTVEVTFAPDAAGAAEGALKVSSAGPALNVLLKGPALLPPACPASGPCLQSLFDPTTGACVESALPDGAACSDACVQAGACVDGACMGQSEACDDQDACTVDACDPEAGCVHQDGSGACPAALDPCKVPYCDPATGCGMANAPDGTACGPSDCVSADICLAGACQKVAVPNGASCAAASPCQGEGTCVDQQCVQPPPAPLQPLWTRTVTGELIFPGLADAQEHLYWMECGQSCELVSVTRDGAPRYRTLLPPPPQHLLTAARSVALSGTDVVVTTGADVVRALRQADGTVRWTRDLKAALAPAADSLSLTSVTVGGDQTLGLIATPHRWSGTVLVQDPPVFVALSGADGSLKFTRALGGGWTAIADEGGDFYLWHTGVGTETGQATTPELLALTPDGVERLRVANSYGPPMAAFGGKILQAYGAITDAASGAWAQADVSVWGRGLGTPADGPLFDGQGGFAVNLFQGCWVPYGGADAQLMGFDGAGKLTFTRALNPDVQSESGYYFGGASPASLTAGREVVVAFGEVSGPPWRLGQYDAAGNERFRCELPTEPQSTWQTGGLLLEDRWVGVRTSYAGIAPVHTLAAFAAPGVRPATHGWTQPTGSPRGGGRPAP